MTRWWRSHSVRVQLTLWYAAAMIVVLGLYAAAVFASVSRSMSDSLESTPPQRFLVGGGDGRPETGRHRHLARARGVRRRGPALAAGLEPGRPAALSELGGQASSGSRERQARQAGHAGRRQYRDGRDRHRAGPHPQQQREDSLERSRRHAGRHPDRAKRGADAPAAQRPGGDPRARPAARRGGGRLRWIHAREGGRWRPSSG